MSCRVGGEAILRPAAARCYSPHAGLIQHTDSHQTANDSVTLKETLGVLLVELEELTSGTTNLGEDEGDTPNLVLGAETVLSGELELRVETRRLVRATGHLVRLGLLTGSLGPANMGREDGSVECSQRRWVGVSSSNQQQQQRSLPQLSCPPCSCTRPSQSREADVKSSLIVTSLTKLPSARRDYHLSLFVPTLHQEHDLGIALNFERFAISLLCCAAAADDCR